MNKLNKERLVEACIRSALNESPKLPSELSAEMDGKFGRGSAASAALRMGDRGEIRLRQDLRWEVVS